MRNLPEMCKMFKQGGMGSIPAALFLLPTFLWAQVSSESALERAVSAGDFGQIISELAPGGEPAESVDWLTYAELLTLNGRKEEASRIFEAAENISASKIPRLATLYTAHGKPQTALELLRQVPDGLNSAAFHMAQGEAYYALAGYERASEAFRAAAEAGADPVTAYEAIGDAAGASGDLKLAVRAYGLARESEALPDQVKRLLEKRGIVLFRDGDLYGARADLEATSGESTEMALLNAALKYHLNNPSGALLTLRQSGLESARDSTSQYLYAASLAETGKAEEAITYLSKMAQENNDPLPILFQLGRTHYLSRSYEAADEWFSRALELKPDSPALLYNRALTRLALGARDDSFKDLTRAGRLGGRNPEIHNAIGRLYMAAGRNEEARTYFNAGIEAHPDNPYMWKNRALMHLGLAEPHLAVRDAREALRLQPSNLDILALLTEAHMLAGDIEQARTMAKRLRQSPQRWRGEYLLSRIYLQNGQTEQALASMEAARTEGAPALLITELEAATDASIGKYPSAETLYSELISQNPGIAAYYIHRAGIYAKTGAYPKAIDDLNTAIANHPDHAYLYRMRGQMARLAGQCENALGDFDKALEIYPGDNEARRLRGQCRINTGRFFSGVRDWLSSRF